VSLIIYSAPVKLNFDFRSVALNNDKAMNLNGTQDNLLSPRLPHIPPDQKVILDSPGGAAIEDKDGNLLAIRLPNVFAGIHVSIFSCSPFKSNPGSGSYGESW
jgi:hypothetical protein